MSDVDTAMMLDLEKKITNRIREQIDMCVHGFSGPANLILNPDGYIDTRVIHDRLVSDIIQIATHKLLNDHTFLRTLKYKLENIYE